MTLVNTASAALDDASTSKTFDWSGTFTPTSGNTLFVFAAAGATFDSVPVGWTQVVSQSLDAGSWIGIAYSKVSDGTETSFSWNQNGARTAVAFVAEVSNTTGNTQGTDPNSVGAGTIEFNANNINATSDTVTVSNPYASSLYLRFNARFDSISNPGDYNNIPTGDQVERAELMSEGVNVAAADTYGALYTADASDGSDVDISWNNSIIGASPYKELTIWVETSGASGNETSNENARGGTAASIDPVVDNGAVGYLGFSDKFSVNADGTETIGFKVDNANTGTPVEIDIYRMGHYAGDGKRLVATVPNTSTNQSGGVTIAGTNGATSMAAWVETASWTPPQDTVSGMYVAAVKDATGVGGTVQSWIPFVVRQDSRNADIVVKVNDSTWGAAYNYYGDQGSEKTGKSLYFNNGVFDQDNRSWAVSYDRPIVTRNTIVNHWDVQEMPMIDWLEENGFDVKYIGCYDLDQQHVTNVIGSAKVLMSVGHDEYWSQGMRNNTEAFRDAGGHLLFFSANEVFWRVRWENNGRTMICYKDTFGDANDPLTWTGTWRDTQWTETGGIKESLLTGQFFRMNNTGTDYAMTIDASTYGSSPFWRDTSVALGTNLTVGEVIGFEGDVSDPPDDGYVLLGATNVSVVGAWADYNGGDYSGNGTLTWAPTMFYASETAGVTVGFGTCQWPWGLSNVGFNDRRLGAGGQAQVANVQMRQATMNLLYDLGTIAITPQSDLAEPTPVLISTYGVTYVGNEQPAIGNSIWYPDTLNVNPGPDTAPYSLATRFSVSSAGTIDTLYYWKASNVDMQATTMYLADRTNSQVLGQVSVDWGTETGWVTGTLSTPVSVQPNVEYLACVVNPSGFAYTFEQDGFGGRTVVSGPITALGAAYVAGEGVQATGFTNSSHAYFIDIKLELEAAPVQVARRLRISDGSSWWQFNNGHVIQDEGVDLNHRSNLNFVGAGVTATDDSGNDATTITIAAGGAAALNDLTDVSAASPSNKEIVSYNGASWETQPGVIALPVGDALPAGLPDGTIVVRY